VNLRRHAKFREGQLNQCQDVAIFRLGDCGCPPSWLYKKFQILTASGVAGSICVIVPNFMKICQTVAEISRYGNLMMVKMVAICHFEFFLNSNF